MMISDIVGSVGNSEHAKDLHRTQCITFTIRSRISDLERKADNYYLAQQHQRNTSITILTPHLPNQNAQPQTQS